MYIYIIALDIPSVSTINSAAMYDTISARILIMVPRTYPAS